MNTEFFSKIRRNLTAGAVAFAGTMAAAEPQHGIAMYGQPALPPDFVSLPYANPDAPKGGRIVTANVGSFDSLNPFIQKGRVHWQLRYVIGESLMGRSLDEPFSLYGVLAESIETGPNREWVEYTLNPAAKFSDGSPVTVEDVIWSFETLGTEGHGRYRGFWGKVASLEEVRPGTVRFTFNVEDRELALLAGLRPILKKAQWDGLDFAESGLDIVPITSSEYVIDDFEAGRFISFKRNPDYWGEDIPFRRGTGNLDEIRMEFFGDETAAFEAFKVGDTNANREFNVAKWEAQYNFPRTSYWSNSPLAMESGPATGRVAEFLAPFADDLLPGAIEGYTLPQGDGTERNRGGTVAALAQMEAAGWTVQDGVMKNAEGEPFTFEIVIQSGSSENAAMMDIFVESLKRLGITATVSSVDNAQYRERTDAYDFDMTYYRRGLSLSPGNEQYAYYGSQYADTPGGRNLMGVSSPAVDAMIGRLLTSESQEDFRAAVKALDRLLTSGRYVIPIYQWNISRLAHVKELRHPDYIPIFGDWPGWQPDVWWWEE